MSVFFNGRLLTTPTTASVVNDEAMRNQNLSVGNIAAFVGRSAGGAPKTALRFASPAQAKKVLRSGELLEAVLKAFDPSDETGAPAEVIAVRVNPAVQSQLMLKDADGANAVRLTSAGYGQGENQVNAKIEAGSIRGYRATVQRERSYFSADNIGRDAFSVQYTGAAETALIAVNATQVVLSAPENTVVATILLADFPTVGALVDRINTVPGFEAAVEGRSDSQPTVNALDFSGGAGIVEGKYTVTANLQALVDWFNGASQDLVRAERLANVGWQLEEIGTTYLTGGSDGVTSITDWADAFEALQKVDVQWVSPISPDAAIHAMADTHASFCSDQLRRERRVICGTAIGTSDEAAENAAKALNSDRTSLVHLGYYDYDLTGKLVLMAPYMTAALIAGAFSGVNPGTPLTNKSIKVRGIERELVNPTDTDVLINAGVLCIENTEEGYKVVKSISTWRQNDNYNRVEQSTGFALDFTVRNVRKNVDALRGQKGNPLILSRARSIAESTLRELARAEPEGPGVLAGDANSPAYRNIQASLEGDVVRIQFECSPVIPANYILVTVYAVPFSGTASA